MQPRVTLQTTFAGIPFCEKIFLNVKKTDFPQIYRETQAMKKFSLESDTLYCMKQGNQNYENSK